MISTSKKKAAVSAALGYIDAINYNNDLASMTEYDTGYEKTPTGNNINVSRINPVIKMKGKKPTSGRVNINSNGKVTGMTIVIGGYTVTSIDGKTAEIGAKTPEVAVYDPGDTLKYDPVANTKCSSGSTCYIWRVITVDDNTSNNELTLQMDHNIVNLTAWVSKADYNDDTNYGENGNTNKGPITALKALETATAGWNNALKLTYSYDTSSATNNYGTLSCTNGACKVGNGTNITTNLKARIITGEEVAAITRNAGTASNSRAGTWTLSNGSWYYFSRNDYVLGTTTAVSQGATGSTELKWLVENTYANTNSKSTNNTYGSINYGYWTLSPFAGDSYHNWFVLYAGVLSNYIYYNRDVSYPNAFGVRPVITVNKSIFK